MNELINDPRVEQVNDYHFVVVGPADKYDVFASSEELGAWVTTPALDGQSTRAANLRSRDEADEWARQTTIRHRSLGEALTYTLTRVGAR
jgi:hypothetical protein